MALSLLYYIYAQLDGHTHMERNLDIWTRQYNNNES